MLGRKQSLKGEPVLADYGPEESLNESADIEWVNKVRAKVQINGEKIKITKEFPFFQNFFENLYMISVMGEEIDAILCPSFIGLRLFEHAKNLWESTVPSIRHLHLRSDSHVSIHRWNDRQDAYTRHTKGKIALFIEEELKYLNILILQILTTKLWIF